MPFELEAALPLACMPLVPTSEVHTRTLQVYRDNTDPQDLRLTEKVVSSTATTSHTHHFTHTFSIQRDIAVPLYTLKQDTQLAWVIEVICDRTPLVFSFANRQDVLDLQRFFTGYEVIDTFRGAETLARLKRGGRHWNSEHHGIAEIQLWEWPDQGRDLNQLSPTSTQSSHSQTPTSSLAPTEVSMSDAVTVQTDYSTGRQAVVAEVGHPPVLVLFLQEPNRYIMMKMHVTDVDLNVDAVMDGWLSSRKGHNMPVQVVTADRSKDGSTDSLKSWNLCLMGPTNGPRASTRICERLFIKFGDEDEQAKFDTALLECLLRRSEREKERRKAQARFANGMWPTGTESPTSPRSSGLFTPKQPRQSQTLSSFHIPAAQDQHNLRGAFSDLAIPENSSSPRIDTVIPGHSLGELSAIRDTREMSGETRPMPEMPGSSQYEQAQWS